MPVILFQPALRYIPKDRNIRCFTVKCINGANVPNECKTCSFQTVDRWLVFLSAKMEGCRRMSVLCLKPERFDLVLLL
jgi:hypothetical protein